MERLLELIKYDPEFNNKFKEVLRLAKRDTAHMCGVNMRFLVETFIKRTGVNIINP